LERGTPPLQLRLANKFASLHILSPEGERARANRHLEDGEAKMVAFCDPERSVLMVREQRKREKMPFAGRRS